jgi:hypothetical protein
MARRVSPRIPGAGPIALTIPGISDTLVAGASLGAEVFYAWPGPYLVSGLWLTDGDGDPASTARLRLRMQDADRTEVISDGRGAVASLPGLAMLGRSFRWQPFRRIVRAGQKWLFQIENDNVGDVVPLVYFRLEEQ